jgi:hypothetical protein
VHHQVGNGTLHIKKVLPSSISYHSFHPTSSTPSLQDIFPTPSLPTISITMFSDISLKGALLSVFLAAGAVAGPIEKRAACSQYTIISTRGTGELQGPSAGFRTMNSQTLAQVPGGTVYNTVYLADASQNSALGTTDVCPILPLHLHSSSPQCANIFQMFRSSTRSPLPSAPTPTCASSSRATPKAPPPP